MEYMGQATLTSISKCGITDQQSCVSGAALRSGDTTPPPADPQSQNLCPSESEVETIQPKRIILKP